MAKVDPHFRLRWPVSLKAKIEDAATKSNRSMNSEIVLILQRYYAKKEANASSS